MSHTEDLMWMLGEVPAKQREGYASMMGLSLPETTTMYHITKSKNAENIRKDGLLAKTCEQSYTRPAAVYLFADADDITPQVIAILGLKEDYTVLEVRVPRQAMMDKAFGDGLFNASFGLTYSAVQYMGSIPAEWIK